MPRGCDRFFSQQTQALTFADVRLRSGRQTAEVLPGKISLETRFSRHVPLLIPLVSAAMDTVTESSMAIAMAMAGGIGVIHRNLSPRDQAKEVARTKHAANGVIDRPICVYEDQTIGVILAMRQRKRYPFHSFPVLNRRGKLVGILTKNDFDICDNRRLTAKKVMTTKLVTAPATVSLDQAYERMQKTKKKVLLLLDRRGNLAGLCSLSDLQQAKSGRSTLNADDRGQPRVAAAIGTGAEALVRARLLVAKRVDALVIDVAHADCRPVFDTLAELQRLYPDVDIVVGNISEPESAKRLARAGASAVKIGQGPGSICTTRIVAGYGTPQVTAVYECAKALEGSGIPVCADGGIKHSGDIPIAIGCGGHSVMIGKLFAGTDEAPGEIIHWRGSRWKTYRGMGSLAAMRERQGSRERYHQTDSGKLVPEGVEGREPYKGRLADITQLLLGGLRSGLGAVGASSIEEMRQIADFRLPSRAGEAEGHPHDVVITAEVPNYQVREEDQR